MTQFSHFPYPNQYLILPGTTTVITQDTRIYIGPNGNDTTGDGSETNPYATLAKAWSVANSVVIRGEAILYITFLKGKYLCNADTFFPETIYHPQANNIIIEGDPRSLTQHYLFSVDDYNWDMSQYITHGHTGTVQLWTRGTTLSTGDNNAFTDATTSGFTGYGTTAHGYTGNGSSRTDDVGSFVSISNPWLAAPVYYYEVQNTILGARYYQLSVHRGYYTTALNPSAPSSNREHSERTHDAYAALWYGHQPAYTSAQKHGHHLGILGLARVRKTSDQGKLGLDFLNMNLDMRAGTFHDSGRGGIKNVESTDTLHEIAGNLPSNQLYDPVGYYGATYAGGTPAQGGRNNVDAMQYTAGLDRGSDTRYTAYIINDSIFPGITLSGASRQVTDEALLVTNYTATLLVTNNYTYRTPINIIGCSLRAIRNLCFVTQGFAGGTGSTVLDDSVSRPVVSPGMGAAAWHSASGGEDTGMNSGFAGLPIISQTPCINLTDASLAIRHIGIFGFGGYLGRSAVVLTRSTLTAYSDFEWYPKANGAYQTYIGGSVIDGERPQSGHPTTYARLRSLNNTPILNVNTPGSAIVAQDSVVDFTINRIPSPIYAGSKVSNSIRHCDESVILQGGSNHVVAANRSEVHFTSANITSQVQFPSNRLYFFLPYWNGMTLPAAANIAARGASTGICSPQENNWGITLPHSDLFGTSPNRFSGWVGYIQRPGTSGKGQTFCRGVYRGFNNSVEYSYIDATFRSGGAAGSTFYLNGIETQGPSFGYPPVASDGFPNGLTSGAGWRMIYMTVLPVGPLGNKIYDINDLRTEVSSGNTLAFHAYIDRQETAGYSGSIIISDKYLAVQVPGGTYEVKSPGGTGANVGRQSIHGVYDPNDYPYGSSAFPYQSWASGCILLQDRSTMSFAKNLILYGGSNAITLMNGSRAYSAHRSDLRGGNYPSTYVLIGGQNHNGIWAMDDSEIVISNLYTKNPPVVPSGAAYNSGGFFTQLRADSKSRITVLGDAILVTPTRTARNCWTKPRPFWTADLRVNWSGGVGGTDIVTSTAEAYKRTAPVVATRGSDIILTTDAASRTVFASDGSVYPSGGAVSEFQDSNGLYMICSEQSRVRIPKAANTSDITSGITVIEQDMCVLGWSGGVEYKIQKQQGITAHRFMDQTSTDPMWRFWNKPMGVIAGSTAFVQFPIRVVSTDTPRYGVPDTIAVDGNRMNGTTVINNYGKYMIERITGAFGGFSHGIVNSPADGGGLFRADF